MRSLPRLQVDYVKGWGRLAAADKVNVSLVDGGESTIEAKNIIIATGSEVCTARMLGTCQRRSRVGGAGHAAAVLPRGQRQGPRRGQHGRFGAV